MRNYRKLPATSHSHGEVLPSSPSDVAGFAWPVIVGGILAIVSLVFTLWEWEQMGAVRNISRSLVQD